VVETTLELKAAVNGSKFDLPKPSVRMTSLQNLNSFPPKIRLNIPVTKLL
jgi:hypothetical protein